MSFDQESRNNYSHLLRGGGTVRAVMKTGMEGRRGRERPQGNWIGNLREWGAEGDSTFSFWVHQRLLQLRS